jgi:hypothetical protein
MDKNIFFECTIIVTICSIILVIIKFTGKYDQVEQFLYNHDKKKYYIMKLCYTILTIALGINIKYAISEFIKELSK